MESQKSLNEKLGRNFWPLTLRMKSETPGTTFKCLEKIGKNSDLFSIKVGKLDSSNFEKIRNKHISNQ